MEKKPLRMKKLFFNPLFLIGLAIRFVLILSVYSLPIAEWYVPFLDVSTTIFTFDPWGFWLSQNGALEAFPYGYVMWFAFLPMILFCKLFTIPLFFGYSLTILFADICLLITLHKLLPKKELLLLSVYWMSPIVLLASYVLGLNDVIPVVLLVLSLYFTKQKKLVYAGAMCIASISAKLSMVIALPFFLIYLYHNRAMRQLFPEFLKGALGAIVVFILPFVFSDSGLHMLFNNPLMDNVYQFSLSLGNNIQIYIVPLIYLILLYSTWRIQRLNFELFQSIMGISFFLVVLFTPSSPGWFLWIVPLFVFYQAKNGRISIALIALFSVFYVVNSLISIPEIPVFNNISDVIGFELQFRQHTSSLLQTVMIAIGLVLVSLIWRDMVSRNNYFRLSRKSLVIGVAGDSGSGKDTFSDAIKDMFGDHSVTILCGDNYHLWDRQKPMWQVLTHLNPVANNLENFANDLVSLTDGKTIKSRLYNHSNGRMSHLSTIKSNDIIVANGLHALYLPILRELYDLSIFLDIDENLRRYFKLKRDVHERNHSIDNVLKRIEKCESDSIQFIKPQKKYADLIFTLKAVNPQILEDLNCKDTLRLKLIVRSRRLNEDSLTRVLIGICGLHVDMVVSQDASEVELTIEGETTALDIELATKMICPRVLDFLDVEPKWQDGMLGLMQLITLSNIDYTLNKRII